MSSARDMANSLEFDLAAFPLVTVRFPRTFDDHTLAQLKAMQERIFARQEQYVSIVDMRGTGLVPSAVIRREAGDWTRAQEPMLKRLQVANVLLPGSALVRAGLQAVHWFAPPPVPTLVTASFAEAARFLIGMASERALMLGVKAREELERMTRGPGK